MKTAYKLVSLRKDGSIGPLFINKKLKIPLGKWLPAEEHETKGFAFRPGWHCTLKKSAPHLSKKNRVWVKVTIDDYVEFDRPKSQGGKWLLAKWIRFDKVIK